MSNTSNKKTSDPARRKQSRALKDLIFADRYLVLGYCAIMTLIFPLFVNRTLYSAITEAKNNFFDMTTVILMALIILSAMLAPLYGGFRKSIREVWQGISITQKLFVAYLLVCLISMLFSPYLRDHDLWKGEGRSDGFKTQLFYISTFFIISLFGAKKRELLLYGFAASITAMSLIGILQYYGVNIFKMYPDGYNFFNTAFITTIGNKNMVSGMMCIAIAAFTAGFIMVKDDYKRWLLLPVCAITMFFMLILVNDSGYVGVGGLLILLPIICFDNVQRMSRGFILYGVYALMAMFWRAFPATEAGVAPVFSTLPMLFLAAGAVFIGLGLLMHRFRDKFKFTAKQLRIFWTIVVVVVMVLGVVGLMVYPMNESMGLVYEAQQILHGNFQDSFGSNRVFVWKRALPLAMQAPILGTGPDTFVITFNQTYAAELTTEYYDFAHNEYIQVLCNYGIVGLTVYMAALVTLAVRAFKRVKDNPVVTVLTCAALTYCIQAFFSFAITITTPVFWIVLGLLDRECNPIQVVE